MTERKKRAVVFLFQPPNNLTLNYDKNWQPYDSDRPHFINFSDNLFFEKWEPEKRFLDEKESIWKEWLGSIFWDEVTEKDGIVSLTYLESNEDSELREGDLVIKLHRAFLAFRIAFPFRPPAYTRSKILICEFEGNQENYKITKVNSVQPQSGYVDPFYARNSSKEQSQWYYNNFHREDVLVNVADFYKKTEGHLIEFRKFCKENNCEDRLKYDPSQLWAAIYCFSKALQDHEIGFLVPNYVRGMDCLLTLSKKQGSKDFGKIIVGFLKDETFDNPFYEGFDLKKDLTDLYLVRNDCVHGRVWDYTFRENYKRKMETEELARLTFVAEDILRRLIKKFLFNEKLAELTFTREGTESYWNS